MSRRPATSARGGTFELVRELEAQIAAVVDDAADDPARLLAARRAALTAVQQVAQRADDSYGVIGELGEATWKAYVGTPWRDLIAPQVYWRDVAELVAFDDYAHLHRVETLPWRGARKADLPLILHSLRDLAESALRALRRDIAAAVFDAADQPGAHRDHLRRCRAALLDG